MNDARTIRRALSAALALSVIAAASTAAFAQKSGGGSKIVETKMTGGKGAASAADTAVFACSRCKTYYTAEQAREMKFKDGTGETLVRMEKIPDGFKPGAGLGDKMRGDAVKGSPKKGGGKMRGGAGK